MIVSDALTPMYAFAYATASALAATESGRLTAAKVWQLAPVRSRLAIASQALLPVICLSWLMLTLPVTIALLQEGVFPTAVSIRPLELALILTIAHAAIGFGIGFRVPRQIAAPMMAVVTFIAVAFSVTTEPFWIRHASGQFTGSLQFGEQISYASVWPHLLLTGSVAIAVALMWLPSKWLILRVVLACAISVVGPRVAQSLTENWGPTAPVAIGATPMKCLGRAPKVCMPSVTSEDLPEVREKAKSVLSDFRSAGMRDIPVVITDRLADGRFYRPSTAHTWRVELTASAQRGDVRFAIMKAAVRFTCPRPDPTASRAAGLWAATVTGERDAYERKLKQRGEQFDREESRRDEISSEVEDVLQKSPSGQVAWFKQRLTDACDNG
ncbi:hypothetical protein [Streptomyces sp. WAC04114]|uniref:DUF7224 domain-containing protein n=1 Tax=Streptomyces sp. WAC04114 TaxID=2867961 RepID=UPI001C8CDA2A|nr:hypothetical protein [Streptomyces sp. WAC04114]MBX9361887.1 hypothetical protein [Streptomyces sp. WAC04114]